MSTQPCSFVIAGARVIDPASGLDGERTLVVVDGRIASIEPAGPFRAGLPVIDARGLWLMPGFVDLQVNGIDTIDVARADGDDWDVLDHHLIAQGVTTWCPTLVTSALPSFINSVTAVLTSATGRIVKLACTPPCR